MSDIAELANAVAQLADKSPFAVVVSCAAFGVLFGCFKLVGVYVKILDNKAQYPAKLYVELEQIIRDVKDELKSCESERQKLDTKVENLREEVYELRMKNVELASKVSSLLPSQ